MVNFHNELKRFTSAAFRRLGLNQLGPSTIISTLLHMVKIVLVVWWLVPGVFGLRMDICEDKPWLKAGCCGLAVILTWLINILISLVMLPLLFEAFKLFLSVFSAMSGGIRPYQSTDILTQVGPTTCAHHLATLCRGAPVPSTQARFPSKKRNDPRLPDDDGNHRHLWRAMVRELYSRHLISHDEQCALERWMDCAFGIDISSDDVAVSKASKFPAIKHPDAARRLTYFLGTLRVLDERLHTYAKKNPDHPISVSTMPSATFLVPYYSETVECVPDEKKWEEPPDVAAIPTFHPLEWSYLEKDLVHRKIDSRLKETEQLRDLYQADVLANCEHRTVLQEEVDTWVTNRHQTLARTVRGLISLRQGVEQMLRCEIEALKLKKKKSTSGTNEPFTTAAASSKVQIDEDEVRNEEEEDEEEEEEDLVNLNEREIQKILDERFQIIIAAQILPQMNDLQRGQVLSLQRKFPIDLVFDFTAMSEDALRLALEKSVKDCKDGDEFDIVVDRAQESLAYNPDTDFYWSCCRRRQPVFDDAGENVVRHKIVISCVRRPGPLRVARAGASYPTEGKPENQLHASNFAHGAVIFAIDMNQDASIEEGFKLPYFLTHYFGGTDSHPKNVMIGFTEWCFSRQTSLVGELMGAAELTFATLVQRTMAKPFGMRLHYGHPDCADAFYIRGNGGMSKASHSLNTSEDIFFGYEALARRQGITFTEVLQFEKAREVAFSPAMMFLRKIFQGNAQSVTARDVYFLNQNLDWLSRFALWLTASGFYHTTVLLGISVFLYTLTLTMFAASEVTFHELGLAGAKISIAWLFQLGFVMSLPYFVENVLQFGMRRGILNFLLTIVPALMFFSFYLIHSMHAWVEAIINNFARHIATGRGLALKPQTLVELITSYYYSAYFPSLLLAILLSWYAVVSDETPLSYFFRTVTIWLVVISLQLSPIVFRAVPPISEFEKHVKEALNWFIFDSVWSKWKMDPSTEDRKKSFTTWYLDENLKWWTLEDAGTHVALVAVRWVVIHLLRDGAILLLLLSTARFEAWPVAATFAFMVVIAVAAASAVFNDRFVIWMTYFNLACGVVYSVTFTFYFFVTDLAFDSLVLVILLVLHIARMLCHFFSIGVRLSCLVKYSAILSMRENVAKDRILLANKPNAPDLPPDRIREVQEKTKDQTDEKKKQEAMEAAIKDYREELNAWKDQIDGLRRWREVAAWSVLYADVPAFAAILLMQVILGFIVLFFADPITAINYSGSFVAIWKTFYSPTDRGDFFKQKYAPKPGDDAAKKQNEEEKVLAADKALFPDGQAAIKVLHSALPDYTQRPRIQPSCILPGRDGFLKMTNLLQKHVVEVIATSLMSPRCEKITLECVCDSEADLAMLRFALSTLEKLKHDLVVDSPSNTALYTFSRQQEAAAASPVSSSPPLRILKKELGGAADKTIMKHATSSKDRRIFVAWHHSKETAKCTTEAVEWLAAVEATQNVIAIRAQLGKKNAARKELDADAKQLSAQGTRNEAEAQRKEDVTHRDQIEEEGVLALPTLKKNSKAILLQQLRYALPHINFHLRPGRVHIIASSPKDTQHQASNVENTTTLWMNGETRYASEVGKEKKTSASAFAVTDDHPQTFLSVDEAAALDILFFQPTEDQVVERDKKTKRVTWTNLVELLEERRVAKSRGEPTTRYRFLRLSAIVFETFPGEYALAVQRDINTSGGKEKGKKTSSSTGANWHLFQHDQHLQDFETLAELQKRVHHLPALLIFQASAK